MDTIKKVVINRNGKKFFVRDMGEDLHTQFGFISKNQLQSALPGDLLTSNTNEEFFIFEPSFIDLYKKIKRDAQIIPMKDIGIIISEAGISKESRILDAGSGSGALACFLASIAREVVTYEIRDDFIEIVKSNIDFLGLNNVIVKHRDVYQDADDKDFDVVTLDVPEPWKAIPAIAKALKPGGFVASYSPSVPQVADFVNALRKNQDFVYLKTVELIERQWEIDERKVRPKSQGLGHSGFLSFARKVAA